MSTTVSISDTNMNKILNLLIQLQQDLSVVKEKVESLEPIYGSEAWWKYSDKKALKSIEQGKGIKVRSKKELDNFFKTL